MSPVDYVLAHGSTIFAIITTIFDIVAITLAITRRRGFTGTLAWIFAILAIPTIGALTYLLLASPRVEYTRRIKRATRTRVRIARSSWLSAELDAHDIAALSSAQRSLFILSSRLTGLPTTCGNRLELLTDNKTAFARIEDALLSAKESIWAQYYIIEDDRTGRRFLQMLADRAREGVEVRLLYDAVGSSNINQELVAAIENAGGKTAAFHPVNPLRQRWAIHLRNHRKMIIVDGERGFTGGMNIGDVYSGSAGRRKKRAATWRDTHLCIQGPAVGDLAQVFAEDWCFATEEVIALVNLSTPKDNPGAFVSMLPSGPDQETNASSLAYFASVAMSHERCYLTSPYFVPDEPFIRALSSAALRGVDVRLLVPAKNDIPLMNFAIRSFYPELLATGVRVFEYLPSMLHAKTIVIDGEWSIVGSANLDVRSFRLNFEVGALVLDKHFANTLEKEFLRDLLQSREVTLDSVKQRGSLEHLLEGLAQLLSPLL